MQTPHRATGTRAGRGVGWYFALVPLSAFLVGVPLIDEGFSWSNLSIFVGMVMANGVAVFQANALDKIHEAGGAKR